MYGAICGDTIGSVWEFRKEKPDFDFELFAPRSGYTDDSIMTIAIADAIMTAGTRSDENTMKDCFVKFMQRWGRNYWTGYGQKFIEWIHSDNPQPYNSWGNGSAMRVSAVGWLYKDQPIERAREVARWSAEVTHNHPEGVKGAESTVAAIWMALNDKTKEEIKVYIEKEFGYDLDLDKDALRKDYTFDVSCQGTVPIAIYAFLIEDSFENAIRRAIWFGGDSDTIGAITGSIAEAYYGIPEALKRETVKNLPEEMQVVIDRFNGLCKPGTELKTIRMISNGISLNIRRVTLLYRDEYESSRGMIKSVGSYWWLHDANDVYPKLVDAVHANGSVDAVEPKNEEVGVRPVLLLDAKRVKGLFKNAPIKRISFAGHTWTMLAEHKALCDDILFQIPFDSTQYQYSKVREYLEHWFAERIAEYK